jgi:hypothetical protein
LREFIIIRWWCLLLRSKERSKIRKERREGGSEVGEEEE